jgi:ABC-type amino acid transport substrate-binding protein
MATETILVNSPLLDKRNTYINELLAEALKLTEEKYGPVTVKYAEGVNNERAKILTLKSNYGDVLRGVAQLNWEQDLIPVRIPILKGLNGLRVLLINKQDQEKFSKITSIEELKKLIGGLGHTWAITKAVKQQGFNIITTPLYKSLFTMLEKKRFDYFSRGLHQVLYEYNDRKNKTPHLHIEETILLYIPLPVFFYVNPNKPKLAERITEGLEVMIKNGSFDTLFSKHFSDTFNYLNIKKRKLFTIENNTLSEQTQKAILPLSLSSFQ